MCFDAILIYSSLISATVPASPSTVIKSPGLPYEVNKTGIFPYNALINTGFNYNATVDEWADRAWFVNRSTGQELWDNLTRHFQAWQYSDIYISHSQWGYAINKDWTYPPSAVGYQMLRYFGPGVVEGVQIPGFQNAVILAVSLVTVMGIGYSLNRKRKRT